MAMSNLPITLHDANILVLGYGRIGKALASRLKGIGANVYVVARDYGDLGWIQSLKYKSIFFKDMNKFLEKVDVIFNTIPALILSEEKLKHINKETLIIDLASKPGGVDFKAAEDLGIKTIHALGLPGKYAPISAARIIKETIYNIIEERGV